MGVWESSCSVYHSHAAYDGAEQEDHVLMDLLASLQQDVEELHKAEGGQKEAQHLKRTGEWLKKLSASPVTLLSTYLGEP